LSNGTSIINCRTEKNVYGYFIAGCNDVTITDCTADGGTDELLVVITNGSIDNRDVQIKGGYLMNGSASGAHINNVDKLSITGTTIKKNVVKGIQIDSDTNAITLSNCTFTDNCLLNIAHFSALYVLNTPNVSISNCEFFNNGVGTSNRDIEIQGDPNCKIIGGSLIGGAGVGLYTNSASAHIKIIGVEVKGKTSYGMYISGSYTSVTGCSVLDNLGSGIYCAVGNNCTFTDNTCLNNGVAGGAQSGILIYSAVVNAVIKGCTLGNDAGANTDYGLSSIGEGCQGLIITDNIFVSPENDGIILNAADPCAFSCAVIEHNIFQSCPTGIRVNDVNSDHIYMGHNIFKDCTEDVNNFGTGADIIEGNDISI
jgi:parallel beta-helix repeat protein